LLPKSSIKKDPTQLYNLSAILGGIMLNTATFHLAWMPEKYLVPIFKWCHDHHGKFGVKIEDAICRRITVS
jgi:hypothetical protein